MKLTKQDILNIDAYLINRGIKFIDIRYELVDHLVSEYEAMENYPDLGSFLDQRMEWCNTTARKMQRAINFGITKALFIKFLSFFVGWKPLLLVLCSILLVLQVKLLVSTKTLYYILLYPYALLLMYLFYLMVSSGFGKVLKKESITIRYLINLLLWPSFLGYFIGQIPTELRRNPHFFIPLFGGLILLSIAAILVFHEKRRKLFNQLKYLKEA